MAKLKKSLNSFLATAFAFLAGIFSSSPIMAQEDPKNAGSDDEAAAEASGSLSAGAIAAAVAAAAAIAAAVDSNDGGGAAPADLAALGPHVWTADLAAKLNGIMVLGVPVGTDEFVRAHGTERMREEEKLLILLPQLFFGLLCCSGRGVPVQMPVMSTEPLAS